MKRPVLFFGAPLFLLLLMTLGPLVSGERTLFLRDAFNEHLGLKSAQAQAMQQGHLPLVAPQIAGGQPLVGNPNAVPLYPDNLLYLVAPFLWAFNAHFWLHLLLAPLSMYALARAWQIDRSAAWFAGFSYGLSGFFLSNLNLYNLVAGAALAPALVAAALNATTKGRSRDRVALAMLWTLVVLAGEPLIAVVVLALAAGAVLARHGRRSFKPRFAWPSVAAVGCGTLLAAPQWIELMRILPLSVRGHHGFSLATRTAASFHPSHLLEWFLPFCFGRPDLLGPGSFWAYPLYGGFPPLFFSLFPGLLVLALLPFSGLRRTPLRTWAWVALASSLFLALGRFNPLMEPLLQLPGGSLLRYPIKLWLPAAMAISLLAALGFQRWSRSLRSKGVKPAAQEPSEQAQKEAGTPPQAVPPSPSSVSQPERGLSRLLGGMSLLYLLTWIWLRFSPEGSLKFLNQLIPSSFGPEFIALERSRWMGLALLCMVITFSMSLVAKVFARRTGFGGAILLLLHGASQLFFLQPLLTTDQTAAYQEPSPLLEHLPSQGPIVHGSEDDLFGTVDLLAADLPRLTPSWVQRRTFQELYPSSGITRGLRYELNLTPEGLSSFLSRAARDATLQFDDKSRLKLLESWGVNRLLLSRPLKPEAETRANLLAQTSVFGNRLNVYELPNASPEVFFASRVVYAPDLSAVVETLTDDSFSAQDSVVLPGAQAPTQGPEGTVEVLRQETELLEVQVEAPKPGAIVWQRAHLAIYRATIDGEPAPVAAANLHRIAVPVPEGQHQIRIWVDRRPFRIAILIALLGMVGIVALGRFETANIGRS